MTRSNILDAGRFNRQLTLEDEVEISDGCGGYVTQFQAQGTVWASICPVSSRQSLEADKATEKTSHRITIRFRAGISSKSRFVTGTRKFQVIAAHDLDETRRYIECDCVEKK